MMRYSAIALALVACGPNTDAETEADPCEVSGNICTWLGVPEFAGFDNDGSHRTKTLVYLPVDVDFGPDGTAYYPDYNNHRVRSVDTNGIVKTISGTGFLGDGPNTQGSTVNCYESAGGCDSNTFAWNHPTQAIVNPANANELWVAAWHNSRLNRLDLTSNLTNWTVGNGDRFFADPVMDDVDSDGYADGDTNKDGTVLDQVKMDLPSALAFDDQGRIYFSDQANHIIRRVDMAAGTIETVAGAPRRAGYAGNGTNAATASLHSHTDQKADPGSKMFIHENVLYYADTVNGQVRTIDLDTMIIDAYAGWYESLGMTTYVDAITGLSYDADAGSVPGYSGDGGPALDAVLNTPRDIAMGIDGELYIAEPKSNCVRVVWADGTIDTFAGTCVPDAVSSYAGDEGPARDATLNQPFGVSVDNEGNVYIADTLNQVIRRVKH